MKKFYFIFGGLILIVILAVVFLRRPNSSNIYTVVRGDLVDNIQLSGTYKIAAETKVNSPKGILSKLYVKNGDKVKRGARLFYIQSTATAKDKAAAFASYQSAQSLYQEALNTRRNTQAAVDSEHDADKNYDGAETFAQRATRTAAEVANDNAWDALRAAEANLKSAEAAYQDTQSALITSPADGTVANLQNNAGDAVEDNILVIADFGNPKVIIPVNEVNINKISIGQKADVTFDGVPGQVFDGIVFGVDSVGNVNQGEITYNITLNLENYTPEIKANMTANITIETLRKNSVLTVPNEAIAKRDGKDFVQKEGGKEAVEVQIGAVGLAKTEITGGIKEGDKIVLPK